ncbi:hypothetical protein HPB50_000334 [Hyalomma asiaticum]|uniref:Uncharacterized protein n=1 Tax=Hyalomma asiaticum TaxID=266040 RepID=A0ACB7T701_HYAAI|nr:hypothetical protein HPB50_000334 [Hyalomma asiaticum]
MRATALCVLLVTLIAGVAANDTHNPHCDLEGQKLKDVVACVRQKASAETAEVTRPFYSDEVKAIIRGHFDSCSHQA